MSFFFIIDIDLSADSCVTLLRNFDICCDIHALRSSSPGMTEKCQTSSSRVHLPSVHRFGLTDVKSKVQDMDILRSQAARTDEKFPGIIHVSHQPALLHGHADVFFLQTVWSRHGWWHSEAVEVSVRHDM